MLDHQLPQLITNANPNPNPIAKEISTPQPALHAHEPTYTHPHQNQAQQSFVTPSDFQLERTQLVLGHGGSQNSCQLTDKIAGKKHSEITNTITTNWMPEIKQSASNPIPGSSQEITALQPPPHVQAQTHQTPHGTKRNSGLLQQAISS